MDRLTINKISSILDKAESYCDSFSYNAANRLISSIEYKDLTNESHIKKYHYLMGKSEMLGSKERNDAIYHLEKALSIRTKTKDEFLEVMIINNLAIAYYKINEMEKAEFLFNKSYHCLQMQKTIMPSNLNKALLTLFNCAKFFSEKKLFKKAAELCDVGIVLSKNSESSTHVDKLYYEKAFNLYMLKQKEGAAKNYFYALAFSELNRNISLKNTILNDIKEFGIKFDHQNI
nr:hypothetical protein [Carnobacterium maltaromaticum]